LLYELGQRLLCAIVANLFDKSMIDENRPKRLARQRPQFEEQGILRCTARIGGQVGDRVD
jgi:hypothetical protein